MPNYLNQIFNENTATAPVSKRIGKERAYSFQGAVEARLKTARKDREVNEVGAL